MSESLSGNNQIGGGRCARAPRARVLRAAYGNDARRRRGMTLPIGPFEAREEKQHGPQRLSCDKFVTCARKIPVPPITSSCRNFARIRFAGVVLRTADAVTGAIMNCARAIAFSAVMASGALIISSTEGARAAPVEYVRICNLYGDGFFYIPGTDTCIKVSSGFAGGFNGTSVGSARFISTDTLAAIPTRTLGVDSSLPIRFLPTPPTCRVLPRS
jgi:hypothetical protein